MNITTFENTTLANQAIEAKPWYRQFWPWFLISLPLSAVLAGIATIIIAMDNPDGVVVDDYYKEGLAINQALHSEKMARQLNVAVSGQLTDKIIQLQLTGNIPAPEQLLVHFIHPTKPNNDKSWVLNKKNNLYIANVTPLMPANWHVKVETEHGLWRLNGRYNPQHSTQLKLNARPE
jgi:hypothetical protein